MRFLYLRKASPSVLLFCSFGGILGGCVTQPPMGWIRTDGQTVVPIQFEADEKTCKGEYQKARLADTGRIGVLAGRFEAQDEVFTGCMAGKGYVQRPVP